jgi:hypothetical protein
MPLQVVSCDERVYAVSEFGRSLAKILDFENCIDGVAHWPSIGVALQERRNNLPDPKQVRNFNLCTDMMKNAFSSWSVANRIHRLQKLDPTAFITLSPFWKEPIFTHHTHFKAKVKCHQFGALGLQVFNTVKASLLEWLYRCDEIMSLLHDGDRQPEGLDYIPLEPIATTAEEVEMVSDTDTNSLRHAFHSTMRGIAHLLTTHIVMDPKEVTRQMEKLNEADKDVVAGGMGGLEDDAMEVESTPSSLPFATSQADAKRATLPPRIKCIRDADTFREFGQRLLINTAFDSIDLWKAQIVLITHLRTLCRSLTNLICYSSKLFDVLSPSPEVIAILRIKFDDIASEVMHPSAEFALHLAKEEGELATNNLGLHRKSLGEALRADPKERLERVVAYMKIYGERLGKVCSRTIKTMEAWEMPYVDSLPVTILVCGKTKPQVHEVPYCGAVARRTHMSFFAPEQRVRKRNRIDAYTLRLVRISTMLVTMMKAECFHAGTFPVRAVRDVAKRECDVADCVYKLCLLHLQNFWAPGMELVTAIHSVLDPSSDVADQVDDALIGLSGVSTLQLEGLFNVRRPTFYSVKQDLHDAIHSNLTKKVNYAYHALGSDIGMVVLNRIKRRRSLVSWLPHETRDPLAEALWRHPAVCAWLRSGGARVRQLRIAAKEVSKTSVGGRAVMELVTAAPAMVKFGRVYDPTTKRKSSAKFYNFDSLLLAKFLKLTV